MANTYFDGVTSTPSPASLASHVTPEEPRTAREVEADITLQRLDAIGVSLAKSRTEVIRHRAESGIESRWKEDEAYADGLDDINTPDYQQGNTAPGRVGIAPIANTGSTIFCNITRPFIDAASARIADMMIASDEKAFSLKHTPIPDLLDIAQGAVPPKISKQIQDAFPNDPEVAKKTENDLIQSVRADNQDARVRAELAEKRIMDWHVECQFNNELRRVMEDAAKVGSGVLKGPVPQRVVTAAYRNGELVREEEMIPVSRRISYWNLFPDSACLEDIHAGNHIWERDEITEKQLTSLLGGNYIDSQIRRVLREKPHSASWEWENTSHNNGLVRRRSDTLYEIWYCYKHMSREDVVLAGCECEGDSVHVQITMINNHIIQAAINPLDSGEFPYDIFVWQRCIGMPWGQGVARQMRVPQKMLNGAARNLMDNAGLAGGPMWIFQQGLIEPLNGVWEIAPRKGFRVAEDAVYDDVAKAFRFIEMPIRQNELQSIIAFAVKLAEDMTGLPWLLQGQQGNAPGTVGGMTLLNNNATAVLRRLARMFSAVVEKQIRRYYAYLLLYGEDSEKGDFQIDARSSSALIERDAQNQWLAQQAQLFLNPVFKKDPAKFADDLLRSQHFDPKKYDYDDAEWEKLAQQIMQAGQTADPRLEMEKMRQENLRAQFEFKERMQNARHEFDASERNLDRQLEGLLLQIEAENADRKLAGQAEMTGMQVEAKIRTALDRAKVDLAINAEKLRSQQLQHAATLRQKGDSAGVRRGG